MTKVKVNSGACGFNSVITISSKRKKEFSLKIDSECEMVEKLGKEIKELTMMDAFKGIKINPVYKGATICLKHISCPVPVAILKALEVEAGLAVARNVKIELEKTDD